MGMEDVVLFIVAWLTGTLCFIQRPIACYIVWRHWWIERKRKRERDARSEYLWGRFDG